MLARTFKTAAFVPLLAGSLLFGADTPKANDIDALVSAGHVKRARPLIEARLQKNPKDAEALFYSAVVKERSGDLDSAISLAEQAAAIDPNKAIYHSYLGDLYGSKAEKVSMFSAMKFAHKIREEGERSIQIDPKLSDGYELMIQYYLQAPGIAGGDKNKAYQLLDKLFQFDGVRANLIRGELAMKDKQEDRAEGYYRNAVLADPNSYSAQIALTNWFMNRKQYDIAEKGARELLRIDRGRVTGYMFLAQQYALQGRWTDLDAILIDSEKNCPDDFGPFYQAGRVLWTVGKDLPRAERYFKKYLSQDPEIGAPALAHAHWRLGLVYEKEGRKPEAVQELQTAVTMKPDFEDAKKDLKRLK